MLDQCGCFACKDNDDGEDGTSEDGGSNGVGGNGDKYVVVVLLTVTKRQ